MSDDLKKFIKGNQKFLSVQDGETVTVVYKGYSIIPDRFNPGKDTVSYQFEDPETGKKLPWNKGSNKIAIQMSNIKVGETLTITRFGEGMETKYSIKLAKKTDKNSSDDSEVPF